jgi:hypothetical protein
MTKPSSFSIHFAFLIVGLSMAMAMAAGGPARAQAETPKKSEDVFIDEGDGDFEAVPMAPKKPSATKSLNQKVPSEPKMESTPSPTPKVTTSEGASVDSAASAESASQSETSEPKESARPEPKAAIEAREKGKKKKEKVEKAAAGLYVKTKIECPMRKEPNAESEQIATTKAPRRIWVQKVDDHWVKAFTKSGEPGYLNTECFE